MPKSKYKEKPRHRPMAFCIACMAKELWHIVSQFVTVFLPQETGTMHRVQRMMVVAFWLCVALACHLAAQGDEKMLVTGFYLLISVLLICAIPGGLSRMKAKPEQRAD